MGDQYAFMIQKSMYVSSKFLVPYWYGNRYSMFHYIVGVHIHNLVIKLNLSLQARGESGWDEQSFLGCFFLLAGSISLFMVRPAAAWFLCRSYGVKSVSS